MNWIPITEKLPKAGQRVLAWLPDNYVFLPGNVGQRELRQCIILRFAENFYLENIEKREKYGLHFWLGEGQSNHYFGDVSHWMPIPEAP